MRAPEYSGSFLGRISIRRNQVIAVDVNHEQAIENVELFQKHISDRFTQLLTPPEDAAQVDDLLSLSWVRKLLDVFLCCEAEFKDILLMRRDPSQISKSPLDRLIPELLDRTVKALDICNAVINGIESIRHCQRLAEIAISAMDQKPIGEGQARRAKKALHAMMSAMNVDDKEGGTTKTTERSWSFGRRASSKYRATDQLRSVSLQVARHWSAAKQIQAMATNIVAPRGADASGFAGPVYMISVAMVFVMWALAVAIPCQERNGLALNFQVPKQLTWAHSIIGLQEKIGEEWKKKEKKGKAGLLEEMQKMEKLGHSLIEFTDSFQFPGETEKVAEAAAQVAELAEICRIMEEGLVPLQMQIREVFHRLVRTRTEFLDVLEQSGKSCTPLL